MGISCSGRHGGLVQEPTHKQPFEWLAQLRHARQRGEAWHCCLLFTLEYGASSFLFDECADDTTKRALAGRSW